jgi:hypothetical protein
MGNAIKKTAKSWLEWSSLPRQAKAVWRQDRRALPVADPGPGRIIEEGIAWLGRAQDHSASRDGGVARHYSLTEGWSASYPETTDYIVPTLIDYGLESGEREPIERARRMLDWLVSIQFPEGGFQGGMIHQTPRVPVIFNTGQILLGLVAGTRLDERYREPMSRAADWLVNAQDPGGCWRRFPTPFAKPGEKTYETHVSLALFRAAALEPGRGYRDTARRQVDWALSHQTANGWFSECCLTRSECPLTHTLGYALRGIVEAYLSTHDSRYLDAARLTADGLLTALHSNGRLPGRLDASWKPAAEWVCLTGASQIAESWLLLYRATGHEPYRAAALAANAFVRRTVAIDGPAEIRGGVKGSYPVDGDYGRWQYLNWACKFTIDANREEMACAALSRASSSHRESIAERASQ